MEILFIFAMISELSFLLNKFPERTSEKIGEYTLYKMKHQKNNIYILHSKIGSLDTAISLTKALNKIKPDFIINAGTAGSHDANLNVGDIIIAKEVININQIKTKYKKLYEGSNSLDWELNTFEEGEDNDKLKIYYGEEKLIKLIRIISFTNKIGVKEGRVASGDIWNREIDRIKFFNEKYSTVCEEMELYIIYKICEQENIPCIGIKIISNNEINGQEYDNKVSQYLDDFLYKIIINISNYDNILKDK